MDFTKFISDLYSNKGISTKSSHSTIVYIEPIISLTKEQEKNLLNGDGQSNQNEYKQINSSTGLAVNYYKILESTGKIENLKFEDKISKPLSIKGGRCANLDVSFMREGKQYYVESKFLEPYYSVNEHNRPAYFEKSNYGVPDKDKDAWLELFKKAQEFKIYNFSQLCRHLLAIWNVRERSESIVFQSVTWKMTDGFLAEIQDEETRKEFRARNAKIEEESKSCLQIVNEFLDKIDWKNITFECKYYDDLLVDIESSEYFEIFKKRYFFV